MAIHRAVASITKKTVLKCFRFCYKCMFLCASGIDPHVLEAKTSKFKAKFI